MKVYFTASARGASEFGEKYQLIYDKIHALGHQNLDDLVCKVDEDSFYEGSHEKRVELYKSAMNYIKAADVLVLELSIHSLSMGYLLHKAIDIGKPVIALYHGKNVPYFASGIDDDKFQLVSYSQENLEEVLNSALEYAQENMDVRFNFFISPSIGRYLDWISKEKKIPRSVYLRALIEQEMRENTEYNG